MESKEIETDIKDISEEIVILQDMIKNYKSQ